MAGNIANLVLAANVDWAKDKIQTEFLKHDLDDLIEMITGLGIPCGKIGPTEQWLDHAQVKAIGMRAEVKDPKRGDTAMPGIPINLTRTPGKVHGPAPEAGSHNGKVAVRPAPARPEKTPHAAAGSARRLPRARHGHVRRRSLLRLAVVELGADVIKVEPLTGDPFRATGFTYNRGMRSVGMDLQNDDARHAFYDMVKISDVVINSLRPGVAEEARHPLRQAELAEGRRHHRVAVGLRRGRSAVAAARRRHGAAGDERHDDRAGRRRRSSRQHHRHHRCDDGRDVRAFAACSASIIASARARARRIWNSLAATATYLQSEELVRYQGRPALVKGSENHRGASWLDRFYKTSDGWVRVQAAKPEQVSKETLAKAGIKLNGANDKVEALAEVLAPLAGTRPCAVLPRPALPRPARGASRKCCAIQSCRRTSSCTCARPTDGTYFTSPGRFATFSRTQRSGPMRVAGVGEHAVDVLTRAGLAEGEDRSARRNPAPSPSASRCRSN